MIKFTGGPQTLMINMENVEHATSEGFDGSAVCVHFVSGKQITLTDQHAEMFMRAWRALPETRTWI
jgi:hypothetical protein